MSFRGQSGRRGISVHGNFSSAEPRRNSRSHSDHAQSGVVVGRSAALSRGEAANSRKIEHFRDISMQDHTPLLLSGKRYCTAKIRRRAARPPQGRRHPGARQGQIHRRFQPARARPMPGSCALPMPTASSAASTPRPPRPCPACSGSGPEPISPPPTTAPSPAACR